MTKIALLRKQLAAAKAEIAALRGEMETLRMRLTNAEMLYKFEVQKAEAKNTGARRAQRN